MSMNSYPFDSEITGYNDDGSPIYDRAADSTILASMMHRFFADGIIRDDAGVIGFEVTQTGSMVVNISPGFVIIQGRCGDLQSQESLTLEAADANLARIDTVVLRRNLDNAYRNIDIYVVKGEAALTPSAPALTRNQTIYELGIANIYVGAGASYIAQANITHTRLDTRRCGLSEIPMQVFDTVSLYQQIQNELELRKAESLQFIDEWMQLVKSTIDSSTEGALLEEIKSNTYQTYAHSKTGTVHNLSLASGEPNIRFVATADFELGDTFSVNGNAVEARMANGTDLLGGAFVSGAVVTCYLNDGVLYFVGSNRAFVTFTIPASGWKEQDDGSYIQTVTVNGLTADDGANIDLDMTGVDVNVGVQWEQDFTAISKAKSIDGGVEFTCLYDCPEGDLPIKMEVLR